MQYRMCVILVCVLLITGCGLKFWYNRLDWVVPWYVDDFIELNDNQETKLKAVLVAKTQWHRKQELPKYVDWLNTLEQDLESGDINEFYDRHNRQLIEFYQSIVKELSQDMTRLVADLSEQQLNDLMEQLVKDDEDWKKSLAKRDPEERLEEREDDIEDGVFEWTGRLTKSQKQLIKQWAHEIQSTAEERIEYRKLWREKLAFHLQQRHTEQGQEDLKQVLFYPQQFYPESLQDKFANNRHITRHYLVALYPTLNDKQKRRLLRKVRDYREDFVDLIND